MFIFFYMNLRSQRTSPGDPLPTVETPEAGTGDSQVVEIKDEPAVIPTEEPAELPTSIEAEIRAINARVDAGELTLEEGQKLVKELLGL